MSSAAFGFASKATESNSLALGPSANATKPGSVAIGSLSVANVAETVSVGRHGHERRIMNVAKGVKGTDAVNLAQVRALVAAAGSAASTADLIAPAATKDAQHVADDLRRELQELRSLVRQQQEQIARLESRIGAVAAVK